MDNNPDKISNIIQREIVFQALFQGKLKSVKEITNFLKDRFVELNEQIFTISKSIFQSFQTVPLIKINQFKMTFDDNKDFAEFCKDENLDWEFYVSIIFSDLYLRFYGLIPKKEYQKKLNNRDYISNFYKPIEDDQIKTYFLKKEKSEMNNRFKNTKYDKNNNTKNETRREIRGGKGFQPGSHIKNSGQYKQIKLNSNMSLMVKTSRDDSQNSNKNSQNGNHQPKKFTNSKRNQKSFTKFDDRFKERTYKPYDHKPRDNHYRQYEDYGGNKRSSYHNRNTDIKRKDNNYQQSKNNDQPNNKEVQEGDPNSKSKAQTNQKTKFSKKSKPRRINHNRKKKYKLVG